MDSQPWCSLSGPLLPKGSRYLSLTVPWILTPKGTLTDYPTSQGLRAASKNQVLPCQAPRSGLRELVSRNCGAKGGSIENHLPLGDLAERGSWASPGKPCCSGGFSKRVAGVDAEGQMIPSSGFLEPNKRHMEGLGHAPHVWDLGSGPVNPVPGVPQGTLAYPALLPHPSDCGWHCLTHCPTRHKALPMGGHRSPSTQQRPPPSGLYVWEVGPDPEPIPQSLCSAMGKGKKSRTACLPQPPEAGPGDWRLRRG